MHEVIVPENAIKYLSMNNERDFLEELWDSLLSRESTKISKAYLGLSEQEQKAVYTHLMRMVTEEGWHPEQKISAQAAIDAIGKYKEQSG
ncbi:MAG: hypothetical protein EHM41_17155 [Chloroflexi bacterium]|nr:MAG: hypothetical protein EHM41_17155 [Chloroflexota bacterium]